MKNIYDLFLELSKKYPVKYIADKLDLNKGTVQRWFEAKFVPPQYYFDLCRIDGREIDYSSFSEREKDQFFTSKSSAEYCYNKMIEVLQSKGVDLSQYHFIEPSAGDGSFYNLLPSDNRTGVDIEPKCEGVEKCNFLDWHPKTEKNIIVGNPPFGMRGHLALKFINHAAEFSDFVCFVLPQLFGSDGKGTCKSRVKGLNLIYSENIDSDFYYPSGKSAKVHVVFQIWSKVHKSDEVKPNLKRFLKLYSLSDGGTPGTTRNKKFHYACDYYLLSTCFGEDKMIIYRNFDDLPGKKGYGIKILAREEEIRSIIENINWVEASFKSTNGALNIRFDIIEKEIYQKLTNINID